MIVTIYSNDDTIAWGATGEDRIVQNVRNIVRTRKFEVPFMRELGLNPDIIDSDTRTIRAELAAHVAEVIKENEDRADVVDVRIESVDENGNYVIAVDLEV